MRVLLLSDGARRTTGFGVVAKHAAAELVRRGHDVHQLTGLDPIPGDVAAYQALGITPYFTRPDDPHGFTVLPQVLPIVNPDVILHIQHPGAIHKWAIDVFHPACPAALSLPSVMYAPMEGQPPAPDWLWAYNGATRPLTCTRWGSEQLAKWGVQCPVPFAYHGVDTSVFKPLEQWRRNQVRKQLGWDGKFVVVYVARNAARKRHDTLILALRLLKQAGIDDVHLYLHCRPFEGYSLEGWHLGVMAQQWDVFDQVEFAPEQAADQGIGAEQLAERMAAADLCVYPSNLEGFGLPLLEAMACGLPIVCTDDHGNMREIVSDAPFGLLSPQNQRIWFNGVVLNDVGPETVADAIIRAKQDRLGLAAAAGRSLVRARQDCFRWRHMEQLIADSCEAAVREGAAVVA